MGLATHVKQWMVGLAAGAVVTVGAAPAWAQGAEGDEEAAKKAKEAQKQADKLIKEAFKLYRKAKDTEAFKKVEAALAAFPKVERGFYLKAEILLMQRRIGLAEQAFHQAIEADPEFAPAHDSLGVVYLVKKEYGSAQKSFEKALEIDKRFSDAHLHLGMMQERQKKRRDAEREYKIAIKLNPKSILAHRRMGFFYLNGKPAKPDLAAKSFLIVTKLDPRDADALFIYGYCLDAQDKYSAAQRIYKKVLKLDPKYAEAWRNLGITHERKASKKALEEALKCYAQYVKLGGKDKAVVNGWIQQIKTKLNPPEPKKK